MSGYNTDLFKKLNILYVEDDDILRVELGKLLSKLFNKVILASDGKNGLDVYIDDINNNKKIDLIISDINMPNMNGLEMIKNIREFDSEIPVILLTAHSDNNFLLEAISLHVSEYVIKPLNAHILISKIEKSYLPIEQKKLLEIKNKELYQLEKNRIKDIQLYEQEKMASMTEMIGNIAHQWRQPLGVISGSTSDIRMKKELGILTDEKLDESLNAIENITQYLSQTIDTFRNFLKEKRETKEIVVQERIDTTINIIRASLENSHITLQKNINYDNPIKTTTVASELSRVIINIINNAKDILIEREITEPWIKISLMQQQNKIIITIEDNGGGISEDIMSKIFDPYFTTKHQSQGTGLGLHVSYKIVVESLKGKLYAKNTDNGARFFIELPLN